jgi:hypothetical protein
VSLRTLAQANWHFLDMPTYREEHDRRVRELLAAECPRLVVVPPEPPERVGQDRRAVIAAGPERVFSISDDETKVITALCKRDRHAQVAAEPVVERLVPIQITRLSVQEYPKRLERCLRNEPRERVAARDLLEASLEAKDAAEPIGTMPGDG